MKEIKCQISNTKQTGNSRAKRGSLLLELLIAISVLAVILSVGSQAMFVSIQSGKISGERDVAIGLASEALEAVRGVADEQWQNVYDLTKSTQHYYATSTAPAGKWTLAEGDETIAINIATYTRYITIDNVSRDDSTREIENVYVPANDDPNTQKVLVTVSWTGGDPVTISSYIFRWRNKVCKQTDWSGGTGSGAKNCPDMSYGSKDTAIDTAGGTLKLQ